MLPFKLIDHDFLDPIRDFVLYDTDYVILVFDQKIAYLDIVGLPRMMMTGNSEYLDSDL